MEKKQIRKRITNQECPYCGSGDTEEGKAVSDGKEFRQIMFCDACDRSWTEFYEFKKVILDNDEGFFMDEDFSGNDPARSGSHPRDDQRRVA